MVSAQASMPLIFGDGDEAQKLISCNMKLQELGINDTITLPRIVVIGDQSTGKSSLIETISGVSVPTAQGLCTRSPININLINSPSTNVPWSCKISVEKRYAFDPSFNPASRRRVVNRDNPLGPWHAEGIARTIELRTVTSRSELIDAIKYAEQVVLSPNLDYDTSGSGASAGQEIFSPNAIRLDIAQQACPNLSFVDLPGVIQNARHDKPGYLVDLVRSLAKLYAIDENNILILVLPMNHDVNNITSLSLIKSLGALKRTMAVFTKPDTVDSEQQELYLNDYFLDGEQNEFEFGQHMVMLKASDTDLTSAEEAFFDQAPFSSLDSNLRQRLGVVNLTRTLRQILFRKTAISLPENLQKIQNRLQNVNHKLEQIPPPLDKVEQPYLLRERVGRLDDDIKQLFSTADGTSKRPSLRSQILKIMKDFEKCVRNEQKPKMMVLTAGEQKAKQYAEQLAKDGPGAEPHLIEDDEEANEISDAIKQERSAHQNAQTSTDRVTRFKLEDIRIQNESAFKGTVPGSIEPEAIQRMECSAVQAWRCTLQDFLAKLKEYMTEALCQVVTEQFRAEKHLPLFEKVVSLTKEFVAHAFGEVNNIAIEICTAETSWPFTMSLQRLHEAQERHLSDLRSARDEKRLEVKILEHKAGVTGRKKKGKEPTIDTLERDPWDIEVTMMARVRAYYEIASDRFVDTICQYINTSLMPHCQQELVGFIKEQLGLNQIRDNAQAIVDLMTEDPSREARRRRLQDEEVRLNEGHAYINHALGNAPANTSEIPFRPETRGSEMTDVTMGDEQSRETSNKRSMPSDTEDAEREQVESPSKRRA